MWKRRHLTDKRYSGDNRLILPKSSHRRQGLAPRCRLIASWGWSRSQGYGCSPFKAVREAEQESLKLELMTDELHRAEYENDKLHISNSVLDNCLSTLNH